MLWLSLGAGISMGRGRQTKQRPARQSQESETSQDQSKLEIPDEVAHLYFVSEVDTLPSKSSRCRDMLCVIGLLFGVAFVAISLGLGAGMAISIQFYQQPNEGGLHHQPFIPNVERVTNWDTDILSGNAIPRQGKELSKVVTQSVSVGARGLFIVEETSLNDDHTARGSSPSLNIGLSEPTVLPKLCPDGETMGYNDWLALKVAIHEANALSAERFLRWNEYFASLDDDAFPVVFEDDMLYYETDAVFTICPGAILRARRGPIFVNAENVVIRCVGCVIRVGGSHLAFGPHAKHVLVRGVSFTGADLPSLTFYHDGAEASFEDCAWYENRGHRQDERGEVADVNSTSTINFYRCTLRSEAPAAMRVPGRQ